MSFLDTLWDDVKSTVTTDATFVESAVEHLFQAEVTAIKPIVETALVGFAAAVAANPTTAGVAAAAGAAWASVGTQLEGTAISTGISTLVTSMTSGMASAVASVSAPTSAAPTPASES